MDLGSGQGTYIWGSYKTEIVGIREQNVKDLTKSIQDACDDILKKKGKAKYFPREVYW